MGLEQTILIISDKADIERDSVADAWQARGGEVLHLGRFWDPPDLNGKDVRVYGADTFCLVLAQKLGLELISPDDELIFHVPPALLGRTISRHSLSDAEAFSYPCFIKPLTPKQFRAAVYSEYEELLAETRLIIRSLRAILIRASAIDEDHCSLSVFLNTDTDCGLRPPGSQNSPPEDPLVVFRTPWSLWGQGGLRWVGRVR